MSILRKIYCFWTGPNSMSTQRAYGLKTLKINSGVEVVLVTSDNLNDYILKDYPLHPAYEYLSYTHRADYLRTYFMHHYGAGYSDIKPCVFSWNEAFKTINDDEKCYIAGYKEIKGGIACGADPIVHTNWEKMIGNCAYIVRPYTEFTSSWINELHRRLDILLDKLKECPAKHPQDQPGLIINGISSQYPVPWSYILGDIFHNLCWKYRDNIKQTLPLPIFHNYR